MARRKRASMREGPLADLFRSTTGDEPEEETGGDQPTEMMGTEGAEAPAPVEDRPTETERPVGLGGGAVGIVLQHARSPHRGLGELNRLADS